jgi:putative tricarboxylic transport membrane protein
MQPMSTEPQSAPPGSSVLELIRRLATRKDMLAGLMFMAIAVFGLVVSHDYPVGTALRMGTGYVPRLLCWILLALGALILLQGLRAAEAPRVSALPLAKRAVFFVTASLLVFGLAIERLGLFVSILLLIGIGAMATRSLRPIETMVAALTLILLCWGIFIRGLGLTIPVWPVW